MSVISVRTRHAGPRSAPDRGVRRLRAGALERDGAVALNYGPARRLPAAPRVDRRAPRRRPGRVIVTNGSLQGFSFVARHLVKGGSRFLVEAPCYDRSLSILRRIGADVEQIELADDGLDVDALARTILRAGDVVYTIPDVPEPERPHALAREPRPPRGAGAREAAR